MKTIRTILLSAAILVSAAVNARQRGPAPQIINVQNRQTECLDGTWKAFVDQYETGYYDYRRTPMAEQNTYFADESFYADPTRLVEYDFDTAGTLMVPGDWNTQDDKLYYYEGTVWYRTRFNNNAGPGERSFIYFGAANYETVAGLNGKVLGTHIGGYTPFNYEVTDLLEEGENTLIVKVDNRRVAEGVPTVNSDWWNYGGITRSVSVIHTPETFIRDYFLQLKKGRNDVISGWMQLDGSRSSQRVKVEIPELGLSKDFHTDSNGYVAFEFEARPVLWDTDNPKLYDITFSCETDSVRDRIGFRSIETRGTKILLNGREIFCKGICIHEEKPYGEGGRAFNEDHDRTLLGWAKELGCNFVRLAHYPHNEEMVRTAEEMGILVWDEIPVYWTVHFDNPDTYANAQQQLTDMITRDKNRANVVIWSVANETPRGPQRLAFLRKLIDKTREMDPTRLVSAAMEVTRVNDSTWTMNDELAQYTDLLSFNEYIGWYNGSSDLCDRLTWTFDIEKPVLISEMGGGALYGRHGSADERFTEEYQAELYEKNTAMLDRIPALAGATPWILKDFRSPKRMLVGIQDDYNRKGLISDQGQKKQAFYVLQRWYKEKR